MNPGAMLAHYRVVSRLGAGGMGEVYLAHDTRLERTVALKILPAEVAADPERMRRFEQEAKAAAALNHPNVAHIYEIGEDEGVRFLAMEYVEGQTLSDLIRDRQLDVRAILDISIQVTDALEEAHSRGITHRDVKPANIMLTSRSRAKVLDFGLAKMHLPKAHVITASAPTQTFVQAATDSGTVVGTVQYMSPEQALGAALDHRSDIFSLGAVMYEMATGSPAFPGSSPAAVYDGILNRTPAPPHQKNPDLPEELERIIYKALEKECDLRYQTVADLRADLKRVRRDIESGMKSAARAAATPRRPWTEPVLLVSAVLAVLVGVAIFFVQQRHSGTPEATLQAIPLTSYPGSESQPSFSPDGNQVAFAWNGETETDWDIYVKVVAAGTPLRLTSNPAADYSPAWSPDGRHIAFLRQSDSGSAFYLIPALGGLEQKLSDASSDRSGLDTPYLAWSPDGRTLAIADKDSPQEPSSIFLMAVDSGRRWKLTSPEKKSPGDSSPVFSPDGKRLAFVRTASLAVQDIYVMSLEGGGQPTRLTFDNRRVMGLVWNPVDGKLIFSSSRAGNSRLWRISPRGGEPERLPGGIGENASFLAISRKGDRLAYTRSVVDTNIWRYPMPGKAAPGETPVRLISSTRHEQGPKYSPDGQRIVFASNRSGSQEIWVSDRNGVNSNQLTSFDGPPTGSPYWSPDGQFIAFDSRPGGNPDIYIVGAGGGVPRRLTSDSSQDIVPSWSRDGRWVYFASNRTGTFEVWKVSPGGGPAVQVTRAGGFHAIESPDGRYIYYTRAPGAPGLWRLPVDGGDEEPVIEGLRAGFWSYWAIVNEGVYFLDRQEVPKEGIHYYLRFFELKTRKDRLITELPKRPFNSGLDISPDGRSFLYTQVDQSDTDIMLVDNFR
jgi:eukaryotic-like serine/threonine-protein kinase